VGQAQGSSDELDSGLASGDLREGHGTRPL
jgi:hypothetical protein